MSDAANDQAQSETYMVEVIGPDGITHHLGPFRRRDDAEGWIAQNARHLRGCAEHNPTLVDVFVGLAKP